VDGVDIEPGARTRADFGFSCRTYDGRGLPPRALVEQAFKGVEQASGGDGCCSSNAPSQPAKTDGRATLWAALGSVASAAVASACCWLPLLLLASGLSAAWVSAAFERLRPFFLLVAAGLLGAGFYLNYFRKESCGPGQACAVPNPKLGRFNRVMLWVATVVVSAVALFPKYAGLPAASGDACCPPPPASQTEGTTAAVQRPDLGTLAFTVEGMSCEACSVLVQRAVKDVPGIMSVEVDYDRKQVVVSTEACCPVPVEGILRALEKAGYRGKVVENGPTHPGQ
jgi:copper chaperone CopZ